MSTNPYISRTLNPNESIVANARLHGIGYAAGLLLMFLGWLGAYDVPAIAGQPWAKWIVLGGIVGGLLLTYLAHVEQQTSEVVITDTRLIGSVGTFLSRHAFECSLARITGINAHQTPLGRLLGYGTVTIKAGDITMPISDVDQPKAFQALLIARVKRATDAQRGPLAA